MGRLKNLKGKKIKDIIEFNPNDIAQLKINKGKVGQILETYLGLPLNSRLTDFDDGELKTNKSNSDGEPKETMFITQLSSSIDDYIHCPHIEFKKSKLYHKIYNLVYLPICKDNDNYLEWTFIDCFRFEISKENQIFDILKADFESMCQSLHKQINEADGMIHTTPKGTTKYIQIRSKDSKNKNGSYHPIFSAKLNRYISNKNHAFYFKKEFMIKLIELYKGTT